MVCTKQFCSYRDRKDDFAALNATVLGMSSQDLASHEEFSKPRSTRSHRGLASAAQGSVQLALAIRPILAGAARVQLS